MNIYKLISLLLVAFLLFLIIPSYTPVAEAQIPAVIKINWRAYSDPTGYNDVAYSACESGDYIYVVGSQDFPRFARIEMRNKLNGSLVKEWTSTEFFELSGCTISEGKLYVVGMSFIILESDSVRTAWAVLEFDLNLNLLSFKRKNFEGMACDILSYNNYLYIAGWEREATKGDYQWRITKWRAKDLTVVKEYASNPSLKDDYTCAIKVNPITKNLWAVGVEEYNKFRIEILDPDLNPIKVIKKDEKIQFPGIDFDEEGNAYIVGDRFIAKYDKDGKELAAKKIPYYADQLMYIKGYIYVSAGEYVEDFFMHVLYVYDKNLNLIDRVILSYDVNAQSLFITGRMAFDGKNLYIVGTDNWQGNERWVIYSISISNIRTLKINWKVYGEEPPIPYSLNTVFSVCEAGDYIYVVGTQNFNARIEMRYKSNGSLVKAWTSDEFRELSDCVIIDNKLCVVGSGLNILNNIILVFDSSLNLIMSERKLLNNETIIYSYSEANSIQVYDGHIYVVGQLRIIEYTEIGLIRLHEEWYEWRIEKRRIEDLTLVKEYVVKSNEKNGTLIAIGINPATKHLWVINIGYDFFTIVMLDLDLNPIKAIKRDNSFGSAHGLSFDEEGNAFIIGDRFIAKYDKDGNEILVEKTHHVPAKLLYTNGYIYVASVERVNRRDPLYPLWRPLDWHILYVYDKNLNQIERLILGSDENTFYIFNLGKMAFDGNNLYIAGYTYGLYTGTSTKWIIYSVSISKFGSVADQNAFGPVAETSNIMYLSIGLVVATAIVSILIILIRRKLSKISQIS
jgi:hypothetical protein